MIFKIKKDESNNSQLFKLINEIQPSNIAHTKTDIFREQIQYNQTIKDELLSARDDKSIDKLKDIENKLYNLNDIEFGLLIDLFLSYRAVEAYDDMIKLVDKMPKILSETLMVQEQLGFALNRMQLRKKAIETLEKLIEKYGKNSETCGILGRVYKDYWQENISNETLSKEYLQKAINIYLDGFKFNLKDAYPGINALTLMDIAQDDRFDSIYPSVLFAVKQKMKDSTDYWDYATLLELYILKNDKLNANDILSEVTIHIREDWEVKTTINNLKIILNRRNKNGEDIRWIEDIINYLRKTIQQ